MTGEPRWFAHPVTKPGYGEPEPAGPVSTRDPQSAVDRCLGCTAPLQLCSGDCEPGQDGPKVCSCPTQREKTRLRDGKIRDLIRAGWRNNDAICEELGISKSTLITAKRRLRERGEIG